MNKQERKMSEQQSLLLSEGLCCPRCDSAWMHHKIVEVWSRPVEDGPVIHTTVIPDGHTYIDSSDLKNPSGRRDGMVIQFWCEECNGYYELAIFQHKGATHVEWRPHPDVKKDESIVSLSSLGGKNV